MANKTRILVTGAGGFIGHHLVKRLKKDGHWVRGVDIKRPSTKRPPRTSFRCSICASGRTALQRRRASTRFTTWPPTWAASATSRRFPPTSPEQHSDQRAHARGQQAERRAEVPVLLFGVRLPSVQAEDSGPRPLKEEDAYPADPEPGYGWEKLFAEELCRYYYHDYKFETRIVRFHNVYGPLGTYDGGARRRRPRFRVRWRIATTAATSRSGATASRRARSCMWTIAWKDCIRLMASNTASR